MFSTPAVNAGIKWVDRGFVDAYDFGLTDFTIDNAWHAKDLSPICGKGVKLLLISLGVENDTKERAMCLRTSGQENTKNFGCVISENDGGFVEHLVCVTTDKDGKMDYHCQSSGCSWTNIQFVIRGWFV